MKAMKNTASNAKALAKLPSLVTELKDTIAAAFLEIKNAGEELKDNEGKTDEVKTKCEAKKVTTPKDCYLECGKSIEATPELEKKWKASKSGGKGKSKGKAKSK